ncbi:WXG100 family type VII secretion target [Amycolatopsis sp. NPDC058278]|uniref:WXG100 family type VII secretion target n=1 Tax=Amycolatopsis sp. NPDC058278 TaxID=3346417 RepID=UPI0036D7F46D
MEFAKNHTLADAVDDIDNAVQAVAGTWTGRAAAQFTTYADHVGKALSDQQDVVGSMSEILSGIAGCVIETYSKAIEFIGTCAVELGKFGYKTIVAIATAAIPIVDAFATLVTAINGLFFQAVTTLGNFRAQATAIVQSETDFPDLPPMPANSGMDNEKQWRIDPTAAPA